MKKTLRKPLHKSLKKISTLTLMLLTIAAIANLRGLPSNAEQGMQLIFYLGLAAVLFFIPTALVSAELATGWKGGIFDWVKQAYGDRWGFVAIWLQWIQNVVWYPTVLAFLAGAVAYIINPNLSSNGVFVAIIILTVYWGSTIVSLRGIKFASLFSNTGVLLGTLIPGVIVIGLGLMYYLQGKPPAMDIDPSRIVPTEISLPTMVFMVGMFLNYAGVEMNAVHARDMKNPKKSFPVAVFSAAAIIVALFILASLAIALVIPADKLNLTSGVMDAYKVFFDAYNVAWAVFPMAILLVFGVIAAVITWISGPSRGLLRVGQDGYLPRMLQKTNRHGVQHRILFVQGTIVSLLAVLFALLPNVSSSYWLLTAMSAQLYLLMYVIMFLTVFRLRKTQPDVKRTYKVPVLIIVGGMGLLASIGGFFLSFVPPDLWTGSTVEYITILIAGILALGIGPFIFYALRRPSWKIKR